MGNTEAVRYEEVKEEVFDNVELERARNYDCVLVFDLGDATKDWKAPADGESIQYDYLTLLDTEDIETRKKRFPQHGADFGSGPKEKDFFKFERKLVIKALSKLRMKCQRVRAFKSDEKDKNLMFYYVGIQEREARKFAAKVGYELEIEPEACITYLALQDEPLAKATVSEEEESKSCIEDFWSHVFIKYDDYVAPQIFKPHDVFDEGDADDGYEDSLFAIRDRCALIYEIVTTDVEDGGAGIYVPMLSLQEHCIIDFFPLHTLEHLEIILGQLFSWESLTYNVLKLPLEEIRVYFGEYIGIYFAFLQFQTKYYVPMVFFGMVLGVIQLVEGVILVTGIAYYALVMVVWAIFFPILWQRREWLLSMQWGTLRFDLHERPRPEFKGDYIRSNVDGQRMEFYPEILRTQKRFFSLSVVLCFLTALFAAVTGVVLLRVYVADSGLDFGTYIISVVNALVIMFFNNIYGYIAIRLNELENYRTETEYENSLITKVFAFTFINSYASLYYIGFFRHYESTTSDLYCTAEDCMEDLEEQLAIIFLTQIFVSNSIELGELFFERLMTGTTVGYFTQDEKNTLWAQYASPTYERTFDDYNELIISFGYASLFAIAFPFAPLAAFLSGIIEARIDGYKICKLTRRPFPRQADDIGSWQTALQCMGWAVLVTNLMMICFTAEELDFTFLDLDSTMFEETVTAMILFIAFLVFVMCMQYCIASEPLIINKHKRRQDHIEHQVGKVGSMIDRFLDALSDDELLDWGSWNVQQVAFFLREVLYKNPEEYKDLETNLRHRKFGGPKFMIADEHSLDKLGITDPHTQRFILNARSVLIEQAQMAAQERDILENALISMSGRPEEKSDSDTLFNFSLDHFMQMADFFETDLTGQSKRRLWEKVDKDMSSIVEQNEMETFLYFSMVVFVKAKFKNANIPSPKDRNFQKNILRPLMRWLLHYKVSGHGLTFEEFDLHFPGWLREYYRENKDAGSSSFWTIRKGASDADMKVSEEEEEDNKGGGIASGGRKLLSMFGGGTVNHTCYDACMCKCVCV